MTDLDAIKQRLVTWRPDYWEMLDDFIEPARTFIAHAPDDIRELIAEVERLRVMVGRCELIVAGAVGECIWCGAFTNGKGITHKDSCEWVKAMGGGG